MLAFPNLTKQPSCRPLAWGPLRLTQTRPEGLLQPATEPSTVPRHRGPRPPPSLNVASWDESEQTQTDRRRSPGEGGMG